MKQMSAALALALVVGVGMAAWGAAAPVTARTSGTAVAATVNGTQITMEQLINRLLSESLAGQAVLDEMVDEALLEQGAKAKNITVSQAEVEARVKLIKDTMKDKFPAYLRSQGITEKGLPGKVRTKLLVEKVLADKIAVSDAEAKEYYDKAKDVRYHVPETVSLWMIKTADEASARAAADRIAKGEDFSAVARQVSTDASTKEAGGLVPRPLAQAQLPPKFGEVAFATEVGKVSAPFEDKDMGGWFIVKIKSKAAALTQSFDAVKAEIISELRSERLSRAWEAWIAEQRKKASIKTEL